MGCVGFNGEQCCLASNESHSIKASCGGGDGGETCLVDFCGFAPPLGSRSQGLRTIRTPLENLSPALSLLFAPESESSEFFF